MLTGLDGQSVYQLVVVSMLLLLALLMLFCNLNIACMPCSLALSILMRVDCVCF
jgi:hypothetical protein